MNNIGQDYKELGLGIQCLYDLEYKYDECIYDSLLDALQCGVLNLCGCGVPKDSIIYIAEGLKIIDKLKEVHNNKIEFKEWDRMCEEFFGKGKYFFFYIMDLMELTEHGSSVPGWVTKKGKKFIELVELALKDYK